MILVSKTFADSRLRIVGGTDVTSSSTTTAPSTTATQAIVTPTISPLSDCPASNVTDYTSDYAKGTSGAVPSTSALNFTKYCGFDSPFVDNTANIITEAFVYTFDDCIEVCAGYNFWGAGSNCTVAVYTPTTSRPGNCWVGNSDVDNPDTLSVQIGTGVAFIQR